MTQSLAAKAMEDLVQKAQDKRLSGQTCAMKPGQIIQSLGPVKRQVLSKLKSEDMDNVRPDSFRNL